MKKIFLSSLMLLSMAIMFTACEDDNDSNPTLVQPSSFTLNNPVNTLVDLAESTSIPFAWSQPDYGGWPAAVEYQLEVSPTDVWTVSTDEADADESGATIATYATMSSVFTSCTGEINASELAKALMKIYKWSEGEVPEKLPIYVRCIAVTPGAQPVPSNSVTLEVNPYYIELSDAPIEIWYLVGKGIGSKDWDNGAGSVAVGGLIPMYPVMGNEYDPRTGQGEIQYAGYFTADVQFKLVKVPGNWEAQLNYTNVVDPGSFLSDEDGDNHNIGITEAGYYRIRLNTATSELVIEPIEVTRVFSQIGMPGEYQGWNPAENLMTAMSTSVENHDWYLMSVTYSDTELKFAAEGAWDVNWGNVNFPYGIGEQNGPNIPVVAGTYNVFFNDILGIYNFVSAE